MYFIWCLLMAATVVSAMENPVTAPTIKKYLCCPNDFGYAVLPHIPQFVTGREAVRLTDFNQTKNCDDIDYCIMLDKYFFARLLFEAHKSKTPEAQECVRQLQIKIFEGKIGYEENNVSITYKDLVHRLFPHIEATVNTVGATRTFNVFKLAADGREFQVIFWSHIPPCIHNAIQITYAGDLKTLDYLFGHETRKALARFAYPIADSFIG